MVVVDALGPFPPTEWEQDCPDIRRLLHTLTGGICSSGFKVVDVRPCVRRRGLVQIRGTRSATLGSRYGTNFVSQLAHSLYQTLGIEKMASAPGHPQGQGLVERFNHTLATMLKMFVSSSTLGDSPFFCLFGHDLVQPLDIVFLRIRTHHGSRMTFLSGDGSCLHGDNTFRIYLPSHLDRVVPIKVDRLKKFQGYWSRPYDDDIPEWLLRRTPSDDDWSPAFDEGDPNDAWLASELLPESSFVGRAQFPD
ncbi:hypothetical protein H257_04163 [Aphanomyces astaci]|uniref:Integrase catalytic domain-containing protein n=1 Tax=Aphanomyces astaci TaxID=112090 RepID=W4GVT9_APHAT|nr:hypothetical protein H257_04163 [Aphanomyces astaci]ETV83436.1 hypothetical protein H257_04163 [Aphanomyces astaci]|eukprot:XP_009826866.1 hypothetical protein H257_04163 [Aphanomyces astaci]